MGKDRAFTDIKPILEEVFESTKNLITVQASMKLSMTNHEERHGLTPLAALGLRSLPKLTIISLSRPCFSHIMKGDLGRRKQILVGLTKPTKMYDCLS